LLYEHDLKGPEFNALGTLLLIKKSVAQRCNIWCFPTSSFVPFTDFGKQNLFLTESKEIGEIKRFAGTTSRKGWIHIKLQINHRIIEILNIHLYHDDLNNVAVEKIPSIYAEKRAKALEEAMTYAKIQDESVVFVLGDFNVRLDGNVVDFLKSQYESDPEALQLEDKSFKYKYDHIFQDLDVLKKLKTFDREFERYNSKAHVQLHELPIGFEPTYCLDMHTDKKNYVKRIPAWADRVLFTNGAKEVMKSSTYGALSKSVLGDHYPVFLSTSI